MISRPKIGQHVRLRYRPSLRSIAPYHDQIGVVLIPANPHKGIPLKPGMKLRGPANHVVELADGTLIIVPSGNWFMTARHDEAILSSSQIGRPLGRLR